MMRRHWPLLLVVSVYLIIGTLYAFYTPPWQVPDEPAHYNYIAQVASSGCCPVIEPGDYDQDYLSWLTSNGFPESADLSALEYEDWQPPTYYLIAAPIYALGNGSLLALRLLSTVVGAVVVVLAYLTISQLLPEHPQLALGTAMVVAFLPQHVAMMAGVNNDSLSELVVGLTLLALMFYLGDSKHRPHPVLLGGLVGLAFLTKISAYFSAILVGMAILWRWRSEKQPMRWLATQILWSAGIALALGMLWWVRNVIVYRWPDFLAWQAHSLVVVDQPRTSDWVAESGFLTHLRLLLTTTFHSFWGQFGWMGVPMPNHVYMALSVFCYWVIAGLFLMRWQRCKLAPWQRAGLGVLGALMLLTTIGYIFYNWTFVQSQGRYFFPALTAFGLITSGGIYGWATWLEERLGKRFVTWLPMVALAWLPLLDLWALFRYITPNLE